MVLVKDHLKCALIVTFKSFHNELFCVKFTIFNGRKKSQFAIIYAFKYKLLIVEPEMIYPVKVFPKTISEIKTNIISRDSQMQDNFYSPFCFTPAQYNKIRLGQKVTLQEARHISDLLFKFCRE